MTCIVGFTDGKRVVIGGDSAGIAGWSLSVRADEKVFRNGPFVIGFTSSFRMGQVLRYKTFLPTPPDDLAELDRFMATSFVDAIRESFKSAGIAEKDKEKESCGTFLVGVGGHLFTIDDDYQVARNVDPFAACGCGQSSALGAMSMVLMLSASNRTEGMTPEDFVGLSLSASERNCSGVRGPFTILSTVPQ